MNPSVIAVASAVQELFKFLNTPEGQAMCKDMRENGDKFEAFLGRITARFAR